LCIVGEEGDSKGKTKEGNEMGKDTGGEAKEIWKREVMRKGRS